MNSVTNNKTLVIYVFHIYNENVDYFLNNAIFKDDSVDFLIVCNSISLKLSLPSSIKDYVKVLQRENIGYDFGGWSDGILTNDLYKEYDSFIFVNSSVKGPFVPSYYKEKWTSIYLNGLTDTVKLFGSTINCCLSVYGPKAIDPVNDTHIQSYIFSMKRDTLEYLIEEGIFTKKRYITNFIELILQREVKMSRLIIDKGWNIGCLMNLYKDIDFTFNKQNREISYLSDIMFPQYYNKLWTLNELVFIKNNRIKL